jgi:hypothetical protein
MAIRITREGTPFPSPQVQFTATVRIGKGQCNWCDDPGTFMITDHTGWEDVACRTHTDEWFPGTLTAYGSEGVRRLLSDHFAPVLVEHKCNCEHTNHFTDEFGPQNGHEYLASTAGSQRALYVGPICDSCAATCMVDYLV